jgi:hypothetical protein
MLHHSFRLDHVKSEVKRPDYVDEGKKPEGIAGTHADYHEREEEDYEKSREPVHSCADTHSSTC